MRRFVNSYKYELSAHVQSWPEEFQEVISKCHYCKGSLQQVTLENALAETELNKVKAVPPVIEATFCSDEKESIQLLFSSRYLGEVFTILSLYKQCAALTLGEFTLGVDLLHLHM